MAIFEQPEQAPVPDQDQLILPLEDLRQARQVSWFHAEKVVTKRRFWWDKTEVRHLKGSTTIASSDLAKLKDPELRRALRLDDASRAVGWTAVSETAHTSHFVMVYATDEGLDSTFVGAAFSGGQSDAFMQNLHSADPRQTTE